MKTNAALIIDDEKELCFLLKDFLLKKFKSVECGFTLKDGLEKLPHLKPAIIFLDNNLPDGSGIEHIAQIKDKYPDIKIIIISAMTNLKETALQAGADYFMGKPLSFKTINLLLEKEAEAT